ncbi:hypothetical protein PFICI_12462 [Pestalotiopsis fici W106-1]|uniref:Uncharacterized protein n=1 Tax=Pestalotiopsis fici (strain W106-1 / CGMCC3.15140) TaxID=1229662 RepID=W3WNT2_PESFW|nr:uncharacterized protein PFICI_12462 [Pestalotiopsis fici W106-1]ETS75518.1 hypothetical protein PFICI_12462 [Pestalotiopsis fici W106-1]
MFLQRNLKSLSIIQVVIAILGLTDLATAFPVGTETSVADSTAIANHDAPAYDSAASVHIDAADNNNNTPNWPWPLSHSVTTRATATHSTTLKTSAIIARETNGDNEHWPWPSATNTPGSMAHAAQPTSNGQV